MAAKIQVRSDSNADKVYTCTCDDNGVWACDCVNFVITRNKMHAAGDNSTPICKHIKKARVAETVNAAAEGLKPIAPMPEEDGPSALKAMLATEVNPAKLVHLAEDPDLYFEQKIDGERVLVCRTSGNITLLNREGKPSKNALGPMINDFKQLDPKMDFIFDGEIVKNNIFIFDVLKLGQADVGMDVPYYRRRAVLNALKQNWPTGNGVMVLQAMQDYADKLELVRQCIKLNSEGIMVKHAESVYTPGLRSAGWRKAKFIKTVDAIVTSVGVDGKENATLHVFDGDGNKVSIGSVSTIGKLVKVDDVVEVKYLYASENSQLVQPRIVRVRTDKKAQFCVVGQLKRTNRGLIAIS